MIGAYATIDGNVVDKPPMQLHKNFYRAISEAKEKCNGRYITINNMSQWALIGNDESPPVRIIVCAN